MKQINIPKTPQKRVVIIGGGFGGLQLAQDLTKSNFQIVLIDRNNFHQFQPLFYQVATAGLEPSSISFPFRKLFHHANNFIFRMAEVTEIDPNLNKVYTNLGEVDFDYLVIATGATTNFFGNEKIANLAMPMKSIQEALNLRNYLFQCLEDAENEIDLEVQQQLLNIVIVGGGPTGVEVAGTLAEMKSTILPKDYPTLDFSKMRIILLEGSPRVLNAMNEVSCQKAKSYLENLGVEVFTESRVVDYDGNNVSLEDGTFIPTKTLVWSAGIKGNVIQGLPEEGVLPGNRYKVNEYNQIEGLKGDIFVIGDVAAMINDDYQRGHPQMAQPAIQQGRNLAKNLKNLDQKTALIPFKYKNLGSMATIGRNKAVVELPFTKFQGFFAWVVWLVVHLKSILGVRNKFLVLLNWIWNYFTYNLSLRLILRPKERVKLEKDEFTKDLH